MTFVTQNHLDTNGYAAEEWPETISHPDTDMKDSRKRILRSGTLIMAGTLASRVVGVAREILAAAYFGGGRVYDAFLVAFAIPALFRRVLGEEMFERAFMPPYTRLRAQGQHTNARRFLARIAVVLAVIAAVLSVVLWLGMDPLVSLLAPGLDTRTHALAVNLGRSFLPYLALIAAATFCGAILLFSNKPFWYSLGPAAMNVAIVGVMILGHSALGVRALVMAYLVGAAAFLATQLLPLRSSLAGDRLHDDDKHDRAKASAPPHPWREGRSIFFAAIVNKSVEIVDKLVASLVGAGAISSLWYSYRIIHLPFAIVGLAVSRAIAPELSRLRSKEDRAEITNIVHLGVNVDVLILLPITVFFMAYGREIITVFYHRGAFDLEAVAATALALRYYALALLPLGLVALLGRVFSALEDNRAPLATAAVAGALNIVLDIILYRTHLKQGGIALATAISMAVQVVLLLIILRRYDVTLAAGRLLAGLRNTFMALVPFTVVLVAGRHLLPDSFSTGAVLPVLALITVTAFGCYAPLAIAALRSRSPDRWKVALAGGGTGGHVYPSLAILQALRERGLVEDACYYGVPGRAEDDIIPRHGIPLIHVPSAPVAGASRFQQLAALATIARGTVVAMRHMIRFRPHVLVASGGYAAAPAIAAAFLLKPLLKTRIVLDEQNLVPGLLNKTASFIADVTLVSFRESAYFLWSNRCIHTGYPVRPIYLETAPDRAAARAALAIPDDSFLVLVFGGSMGARSINNAIADAAADLSTIPHLHLVHGTGLAASDDYDAWEETVSRLSDRLGADFDPETGTARRPDGSPWYRVHRFLHDIITYQRAADVVICRAGAGSLSEGLSLGSCLVLVPKRNLPGDHQELNAIAIAEEGAAEVVFERSDRTSFTDVVAPADLVSLLRQLEKDPGRRRELGDNARRIAATDPLGASCRAISSLMHGRHLDFLTQITEPRFVKFQRSFDALIGYLDSVAAGDRDNLYVRLYDGKVSDYLAADHWMAVNKGIKLIGALRRADLYPFIYDGFDTFLGFQRRNALAALRKSVRFHDRFADMIRLGLADDYFEVRREAVRLFNRFHSELQGRSDIHTAILSLLHRRRESFEVRAAAIKAAVRILDQREFLAATARFRMARNTICREALLAAIRDGLDLGRLPVTDSLRAFLKGMPITTSRFSPSFAIRKRFIETLQQLEGSEHV